MLNEVAAVQGLVIGAILVWAGTWKVFAPGSRESATRSALAVLFSWTGVVHGAYRALGAAEAVLGFLLLLPPQRPWAMRLASGLAVLFVVYLLVSMRVAPTRPCACLGWRGVAASWRGVARALLVLLATVAGWNASGFWLTLVSTKPWYLGLVAAEGLLFLALSPEIDWAWMRRIAPSPRRVETRVEEDCAFAAVPLSDTVGRLRKSALFKDLAGVVKSDLVDHWRQGCWRFLCFMGEYQTRKATVIFAVPVSGEPDRMRAAVVDEAEGTILLSVGPTQLPDRRDVATAEAVGRGS